MNCVWSLTPSESEKVPTKMVQVFDSKNNDMEKIETNGGHKRRPRDGAKFDGKIVNSTKKFVSKSPNHENKRR